MYLQQNCIFFNSILRHSASCCSEEVHCKCVGFTHEESHCIITFSHSLFISPLSFLRVCDKFFTIKARTYCKKINEHVFMQRKSWLETYASVACVTKVDEASPHHAVVTGALVLRKTKAEHGLALRIAC